MGCWCFGAGSRTNLEYGGGQAGFIACCVGDAVYSIYEKKRSSARQVR